MSELNGLTINQTYQKIINLCERLYVDESGVPFRFPETQRRIIETVAKPIREGNGQNKYVGIVAPTQYGKSLSVALPTLLVSVALPLRTVIVAPTKEKTRIIMNYVIGHIFDHRLLISQLIYEGGKLEQLRQQRNKNFLSFRRKGSVKILTADARNKRHVGETVLGEGADIVILDESSLIDDDLYAMIFRMVGGSPNARLIELGNTIRRNHFHRLMTQDKDAFKIWIDYKTGLADGRYTPEFIERAKKLKFFKILYGCQFPDETEQSDEGYFDLLTYSEIEKAMESKIIPEGDDIKDQLKSIRYKINSSGRIQIESKDEMKARGIDSPDIADAMALTFAIGGDTKKLGIDIGAGGAESVYVARHENKITLLDRDNINDTMVVCGKIKMMIKDESVMAEDVAIDKDGIGKGVVDRLIEQEINVNGVNFGEKASTELKYQDGEKKKVTDFANRRAEIYWRLKEFVTGDYKPIDNDIKVRWVRSAPESEFDED